ncbi:MAG: Bax inhibitor-1/YccA family protein [Gammaproteobacteria bacterium]|nr:Bax inhibitor-1/YccA family protein [Gammaproteobacteria bacterium]
MKSGNPVLAKDAFSGLPRTADPMTIGGTVNRSAMLLAILLISAGWTWGQFWTSQNAATIAPYMWGGIIGGLVLALVTVFKKNWAPVTAPLYALLEGFAVGGLSAMLEMQYAGIVIQAVGLTFGTMVALLLAYRSGLIQVTEKFRMGIIAATGGIFIVYLVDMVLHLFGVSIPFIHESGALGIGFSIAVVIIAALNLVLDFDLIAEGARSGAPKYMEWFGAFAFMVTLIWLYFEILRLLAKTRR